MRFAFCLASLLALGSVGCSGPADTPDAFAAPDDGTPDDAYVVYDAAQCALECQTGFTCCLGPAGPRCVDLANDITNCGICNRDCVATRRGDRCMHFQCGCGDFEIGCTGNENSICCTNVPGHMTSYCANPGLELDNCGGCGHTCNVAQASQCSGGMCFCGGATACSGAVDDTCCSDPAGAFTCVDTTSDQAHCGGCGHRCTAFEHCVSSNCVSTLPDAGT